MKRTILLAMLAVLTCLQSAAQKTVYIPYEATGMLGSLGSIKEIFNK